MSELSSKPATSYDEAAARIEAIRANEPPTVRADCTIQWMTHGRKTERALVLLHGLTNCPLQCQDLAPHFFEMGYNVLMPRMPHHGYSDRLTNAIKAIRVDELKRWAQDSVDIAQGLGERVSVAGISIGGVLAMWQGHVREDVDLATGIAPVIALKGMGFGRQRVVTRLMAGAPNIFSWWDPRVRERLEPDHVYPRFSTHAVARGFELGAELMRLSAAEKPKAKRLRVIASAGDPTVNNALAKTVIDNWRTHGAEADYHVMDWGMIHDIIDAKQAYAKIDEVYPVVIPLLAGE